MPGDGQIIPNGSVHWHIRHFGKPGRWTDVGDHRPGQKQDVAQDGQGMLIGVEPADAPDSLTVTLRFRTEAEAQAAFFNAVRRASPGAAPMWEIVFTLPWDAVTDAQADAGPQNPRAPLYFRWGPQQAGV
jgi:hypothetical protein